MNRLCALYARISSDDGSNNSVSIHRQCEELLAAAHANSDSIPPDLQFIDEGKSGRNLKRPAVQQLISLITAGKLHRLYIYELSRLSRSVVDTQHLLDLCQKHNVELIVLYGFVDQSTPEGEFATGIQTQLNQYWSRKTSFSLKRYRKHARASGIYHSHKAPLGLSRSGKFPNIAWATTDDFPLVLEILELYIAGHGSSTITRTLNERGRTWKSGKVKRLKVNPDSVVNLINGIERYEPFLDPPLFALVLSIRSERKDRQANHAVMKNDPALLRGLVVCAVCGTRYTSGHHPNDKAHEWTYYHPNYVRCSNPRKAIPRHVLDAQARQWRERVMRQVIDPAELERKLSARDSPLRDFDKEQEQLENLLKNYARMLASERLTETEYDTMRAEALQSLAVLETERRETRQIAIDPRAMASTLANLYELIHFAETSSPNEANLLMRLLFDALPVLGTELQTPVLHPALVGIVTLD